jgi:hypothetical protein
MDIGEIKLKELLIDSGILTREQFLSAKKLADESKTTIAKVLTEKDFITEEQLGHLIAEDLGVLFISLRKIVIADEVLKIIPQLVAKTQKIIAFQQDKEGLRVAMTDPKNLEMIKWLEKKTGNKRY